MRLTEITRAEIIDHILARAEPFHGKLDIIAFLERVWPLQQMPSTDSRFTNAAQDIWQHTVAWPQDLSSRQLLVDRLGLLAAPDEIFLKFLVESVHPSVLRGAPDREMLPQVLNNLLALDGYQLEPMEAISGRPVYGVIDVTAGARTVHTYEIALSYASENRAYVEAVASELARQQVSVFYDRYEQVTLWGVDLTEHLERVYRSARYCVLFVSAPYAEKIWTNHERRSALSRAVECKGEYLLPVRFDDTPLHGLRHTVGFVRATELEPGELARMVLEKLRGQQTK